ncbi:MAG: ABC transporter ATP-binding protein [Bifidobacterium sp.]|nr:ABC transporter ATP-binding protein [Bifidobacterium sp.]
MTGPVVALERAAKRYGDFALDLSLRVMPGMVTALVGVNGSGKTTAFRLALGLARPDSGRALLFGAPADAAPVPVRRRVAAVFADSDLGESSTPRDLLAQLAAFYPAFDADACRGLLERLGVPDGKALKVMSTGMRAKCKMALALCRGADLLVLDEPTAGLDVIVRETILDLLRAWMETPGRSILVSSHNARDLESLCDDFYYLRAGRVCLHETIDRLRDCYGVILADDSLAGRIDDTYILARRRVPGGWRLLTDQCAYYRENVPGIQVERGDVDALVTIMEKGTLR